MNSVRSSTQNQQAQFLSGLIHDIRNQQAVISISSDLLKKIKKPNDSSQASTLLERIDISNELITRHTQQLTVLKLHLSEKIVLYPKKSDLRALMELLLTKFRRIASSRGVQLEYIEKTNRKAAWVSFDEKLLLLALECLFDNAIRFSKKGQVVRLGLMKSHTEFVVEILDHGKGIREEHRSFIFDPYFSTDSKKKLEATHLGMGLTIAKEIIEQHKSILDIRSQPHRGTIVFVHFPTNS